MSYTVVLYPSAERERRRLQGDIRERVNHRLLSLEQEPRPPGVEKLVGRPNAWRIRAGEYRILYEIDDAARRVAVFRIAHRRDVYRR